MYDESRAGNSLQKERRFESGWLADGKYPHGEPAVSTRRIDEGNTAVEDVVKLRHLE